ncbi:MAG: DNA repair protein RecN [Bacteroidetes bacterium]|nr:DNA repair protein RecN [Bacteroidota bacterium]
MLQKLHISNFVLINELSIAFPKGFAAITGETGAGKSIILDALLLLLGQRADTQVLADKNQKAVIEGVFLPHEKKHLSEWLQEHDIDEMDEIILRREINPLGKSRAFINDTPVNLSQLKSFTQMLIDIHQQFDTQEMSDALFQQTLIDTIAGCLKETYVFEQKHQQYRNVSGELEAANQMLQTLKEAASYKSFLAEELNEAQLKAGEDKALETDWALMKESDALTATLNEALHQLQEGNNPMLASLKKIENKLNGFSQLNETLQMLQARWSAVRIELNDIAKELESILQTIDFDEAKKNEVIQRLELIYRLQKKHQVNSLESLLEIREELAHYQKNLETKQQHIHQLTKQIELLQKELLNEAEQLHQKRIAVLPDIQKKVTTLLQQIGMPHARFKVNIEKTALHAGGIDRIQFLFNANVPTQAKEKEIEYHLIEKVASGGERSRLMLCLQSMVAAQINLPTLVFDEIDTGISGEAALQVSKLLADIAQHHQVIAITHLPPVAAKANTQFLVAKKEIEGKIQAEVKALNESERVEVLAAMLGGKSPSDATRKAAEELLRS